MTETDLTTINVQNMSLHTC